MNKYRFYFYFMEVFYNDRKSFLNMAETIWQDYLIFFDSQLFHWTPPWYLLPVDKLQSFSILWSDFSHHYVLSPKWVEWGSKTTSSLTEAWVSSIKQWMMLRLNYKYLHRWGVLIFHRSPFPPLDRAKIFFIVFRWNLSSCSFHPFSPYLSIEV